MNTVNERIQHIIDEYFDGNVSMFSREVGIKQSTLSTILGERKSKPSYEILFAIVSAKALNISSDWLLTGNGEMLKYESESTEPQSCNQSSGKDEPEQQCPFMKHMSELSEQFSRILDNSQKVLESNRELVDQQRIMLEIIDRLTNKERTP